MDGLPRLRAGVLLRSASHARPRHGLLIGPAFQPAMVRSAIDRCRKAPPRRDTRARARDPAVAAMARGGATFQIADLRMRFETTLAVETAHPWRRDPFALRRLAMGANAPVASMCFQRKARADGRREIRHLSRWYGRANLCCMGEGPENTSQRKGVARPGMQPFYWAKPPPMYPARPTKSTIMRPCAFGRSRCRAIA